MGAVPITVRYLPKDRAHGRPGYAMTPTSITIHNTANERSGADAEAHARYLEAGHRVSWHYTVDHDSIVQHIPLNEQAWHTGTNAGNTTSIGIEICEYPQTDAGKKLQATATENAVWLGAKLIHDNPMLKQVRTHQSWKQYGATGKYCPRDLLAAKAWPAFVIHVCVQLAAMNAVPPTPKPATAPLWRGRAISNTWLARHRKDARVVTWQKRMNALGYTLAVDGLFGPRSAVRLKQFQTKYKLVVDGKLGPKSWAAAWR